jgi:hypothetical protein
VEGGDDSVPDQVPEAWDMDRVMAIADLVQKANMTVLPE